MLPLRIVHRLLRRNPIDRKIIFWIGKFWTCFARSWTLARVLISIPSGLGDLVDLSRKHIKILILELRTKPFLKFAFIEPRAGCAHSWPGRLIAPAITLDQLIERHGEPIFAKIDVEGFEAEALAGLSRPLQALSFEFTTILRRVAIDCITRCRALGAYRYNAALGETQRLAFTQWVDAETIERWLEALPDSANSGDIYARLQGRTELHSRRAASVAPLG